MTRILLILFCFWAPWLAAQTFDGLGESIEQGSYGNLKAVIVSRHGEILYEEYFRGTQADNYDHGGPDVDVMPAASRRPTAIT